MVLVDLRDKKIERFLTAGRTKLLRLAVSRGNRPHVSSVWYLWDGRYFWISTAEDRLKAKILKKNPRVALIIDTDTRPYEGVIVEGTAKLTKTKLREITLAIVRKYVSRRHAKMQFEALMRAQRILIRVKPERSLDIMSYKERR